MPIKKNYTEKALRDREIKERKKIAIKSSIFFTLVGVLIGFSVFVLWVGGYLRTWVDLYLQDQLITQMKTQQTEQTESVTTEEPRKLFGFIPLPSKQKETEKSEITTGTTGGGRVVSASFSDLFSGVGWLNYEKTTMYRDVSMTAFTLSPTFQWNKLLSSPIGEENFVKINEDESDARCINNKCLTKRGASLFFDGKKLNLPYEMQGKDIKNVSIGALSSRWVLGVVVYSGNKYEGWVFLFDGENFSKVFGEANTPFISDYVGTIGFGGTEEDWVVIYGGYDGIAYHVRSGRPFVNISQFFGMRVMGGGFNPVAIRAGSGNDATWYVFSMTKDKPHFIKLFQDKRTGEISGAVDFSLSVLGTGFTKAVFAVEKKYDDHISLIAKCESNDGSFGFWEFKDNGFSVPASTEIVSLNLNNYPAEVHTATILETDLEKDNADVEFYLSNDGSRWIKTELGKEVVFPSSGGRMLLWKAKFIPSRDNFESPFFDKIRIDYVVRFL